MGQSAAEDRRKQLLAETKEKAAFASSPKKPSAAQSN